MSSLRYRRPARRLRRMGRIGAGLMIAGLAVSLASCYSMGGSEKMASGGAYPEERESYAAADEAPAPAAPAGRSAAGQASSSAAAGLVNEDVVTSGTSGTEADTETAQTRRLRVYSADLELVVASIEESRSSIIEIVETAGGYVESSTADYLVVRVPADLFDPVLDDISRTGEIRSRSVRTSDVTDQYFDLERRLRISEASRERLIELLEQAEDPDERVEILRDIRRLTEEIEQLRSSLESLDQLIRYSRITIQLISRIQVSQIGRQDIPFAWIAALAPLGRTTLEARADIGVTPDDSFAVFEHGRTLFAEAADGTQLRGGAVGNEPEGDAVFWQDALLYHLGPYYRSAVPVEAGAYRGVLFESKDADPFSYLVAVEARESELVVVETFFPDGAAKDARLDGILTAIAGGSK